MIETGHRMERGEAENEERGGSSGGFHRFLDRSKVKILLCDGDESHSREALNLLSKCAYQVVLVKTARQVIDALHQQGSEIDIILSEVDLPVSKGFKMLKYIMKIKELRHIPVVMMSSKDEVSVVVKCLRLGAADFLVKPLRTNELLNLWIHMWRRTRMLYLPEKNIWVQDVEMSFSEPSDGNTNSTLLSDDTDDKSRRTVMEGSTSRHQGLDGVVSNMMEDSVANDELSGHSIDAFESVGCLSGKSLSGYYINKELKVAKSSAFLTYVKSNSSLPMKPAMSIPMSDPCRSSGKSDEREARGEAHHLTVPEGCLSLGQSGSLGSGDGVDPPAHQIPYVVPHALSQNAVYPLGYTSSVSFYPVAMGGPSDQTVASNSHAWSSIPCSVSVELKTGRCERREAALLKFRQKRKDRCFDKKIRYVNRKQLAERRPRVRGQFVRRMGGASEYSAVVADFEDGEVEDDDDCEDVSTS